MTKFLLLACAALCAAPAIARGQIDMKGGLSYSRGSSAGGLPAGNGERNGFVIGVGATSGGVLGLGVEGLYAQRGTSSAHLDYIDVPVYVRVAAPGPVSPFAYVGPQVSFELQCGSNSDACAGSGRKKVSYSGMIGAGLKFAALNNISIEGRYLYGLTNLSFGTVSSASSYKARALMLLAGVGF